VGDNPADAVSAQSTLQSRVRCHPLVHVVVHTCIWSCLHAREHEHFVSSWSQIASSSPDECKEKDGVLSSLLLPCPHRTCFAQDLSGGLLHALSHAFAWQRSHCSLSPRTEEIRRLAWTTIAPHYTCETHGVSTFAALSAPSLFLSLPLYVSICCVAFIGRL
jgi:hypothetical protein